MLKLFLVLLVLPLALISCRDADERPLIAPYGVAPVSTGYARTSERGDVLGTYGRIGEEHRKGKNIEISYLYPNPTYRLSYLNITINKPMNLVIWVKRCAVSDELNKILPLGSGVYSQSTGYVDGVLDNSYHTLKEFQFSINTNNGMFIENGFYRIYVQTDEDLVWSDLVIYRVI